MEKIITEPNGTTAYHLTIEKGKQITIKTHRPRHDYKTNTDYFEDIERTFKIGDPAEYDSYNLAYVGDIISIGEKTVTIEHHGEKSRLSLDKFAWRNCDFDLEKITAQNNETSYYI